MPKASRITANDRMETEANQARAINFGEVASLLAILPIADKSATSESDSEESPAVPFAPSLDATTK